MEGPRGPGARRGTGGLTRLLAAATVLAGFSVGGGSAARAEAPDATAWWNVANRGPVHVPPPPDVQGDMLLVQGAAPGSAIAGEGPLYQAVAAVRYTLAAGSEPESLVLELAEASAPAPAVRACRIEGDFRPVRNGAWSDVPRYDCKGAVTAEASDDGLFVTFADVSGLADGNHLALALLPVAPTRVVLAPPSAASLRVTSAPEATSDSGLVGAEPSAAPLAGPDDSSPPVIDSAPPARPGPTTAAAPGAGTGLPWGRQAVPVERVAFGGDSSRGKLLAAAVLFVFLAPFTLRGLKPARGGRGAAPVP